MKFADGFLCFTVLNNEWKEDAKEVQIELQTH